MQALGGTDLEWDVRDYALCMLLLLSASPLGFSVCSYATCAALVAVYWGLPPLIRLRWPTFLKATIVDDLDINAGASLSLAGSMAAFILQNHNTSISLAMKVHSDILSRPLIRLLRTYLYVEIAFNGSSEEREQIASWLRWMHRHINGSITPEMRTELGLPGDIDEYGYFDELKAYVMQTLTWATIAFQDRFGRRLSSQARDTIVLEYTCAGMRLGVPQSLLTTNYDDFLVSFHRRLDRLEEGCALNAAVIHNIELAQLQGKLHPITSMMIRAALMVGFSLLPERVQSKYQLISLQSRYARGVQRILCAVLWALYPFLMCIPLRGMICLLLILEPKLRTTLRSSLQSIHSMDLLHDQPMPVPAKLNNFDMPVYLTWLAGGKRHPTVLQMILVRTLEAQLRSTSPARTLRAWITYPYSIAATCVQYLIYGVDATVHQWRAQLVASDLFHSGSSPTLPVHIGIIMDGNRRFARQLGKPVLAGHTQGAVTASKVLEWWFKYLPNTPAHHPSPALPKYLTCWAFSAENFTRGAEERDGLFALMAAEFKSLAFTSLVHLFRVRVSFIGGDRHRFPPELLQIMNMVEDVTSAYDSLFLQIAVGYGGRQEVVSAVQHLLDEGTDITEQTIGTKTYCHWKGIPPVSLILRTSERRTSGFFLWDTQTAELHFVDKLWPQLTELDWLHMLSSFSKREIRGGR